LLDLTHYAIAEAAAKAKGLVVQIKRLVPGLEAPSRPNCDIGRAGSGASATSDSGHWDLERAAAKIGRS